MKEQQAATQATTNAKANGKGRTAVLTRFSDIPMTRVLYAWDGKLVAGAVNAIFGIAGRGKSTTTCWLTASFTNGTLEGDFQEGQTGVIIASAEDPSESVIGPRLEAAGAKRKHVFQLRITGGKDTLLVLPTDVDLLFNAVQNLKGDGYDNVVVFIDPFRAHLRDEVRTDQDHVMRNLLNKLNEVATKTGACIILVDHPNKRSDASDMASRYSGAGVYNAIRSALVFGVDPDNPKTELRILAAAKANWSKEAESMRFSVDTANVRIDDGKTVEVSRLNYVEYAPHISGPDVLEAESPKPNAYKKWSKAAAAEFFTKGYLMGQPDQEAPADTIKPAVRSMADISERYLVKIAADWTWMKKDEVRKGYWIWKMVSTDEF